MNGFFFERSHGIIDRNDSTGNGSSYFYGESDGNGWGCYGGAINDGDGLGSGDDMSEHFIGDSCVRSPERDTHPPEYDCTNNGNGFGVALDPSLECGMWVMDV